jgi:hypothetical protein
MTDFPPPPGFDGWSVGEWGDRNYERACTPEEAAILDADRAAVEAEERADEENLPWFRVLRNRLEPEETAADEG